MNVSMSCDSNLQLAALVVDPPGLVQSRDFHTFIDATVTAISKAVRNVLSSSQTPPELLRTVDISTLNKPSKRVIRHLHALVLAQTPIWALRDVAQKVIQFGYLLLPSNSLETVQKFTQALEQKFPPEFATMTQPAGILGKYPNITDFVTRFNSNQGEFAELRKDGIKLVKELAKKAWRYEDCQNLVPDNTAISTIRGALFEMCKCKDYEINERALRAIIEILECDPIEEISAFGLVTLHNDLLDEIDPDKMQKLPISLQRLLIRAYAVTVECIILNAASGKLNALTQKLKQNSWDSAKSLEDFNRENDPEIAFWAEFAFQGVQRIRTELTTLKEWLPRVVALAQAAIKIASLIKSPQDTPRVVMEVVTDLVREFRYFQWHREWFTELMYLRRISRYSLYDLDNFRRTATLYQEKILESSEKKVLFGCITTLDHVLFHSPSSVVQEEAMKLLIQLFMVGSPEVRQRIVVLFMEAEGLGGERGNTARAMLMLLNASGMYAESFSPVQTQLQIKRPSISKKVVFRNAVKFLLRRLGDIKIDTGGNDFSTLICGSQHPHIVPPLLRTLITLFPEVDRDIYGNTLYHIAVRENLPRMIDFVATTMRQLDINAPDGDTRSTPLHLAAEKGSEPMIKALIARGAKLDTQDNNGNTPLHRALMKRHREASSILVNARAPLNTINFEGKTPLNIAITSDDWVLTEFLIHLGATILGDSAQFTPITYAAHQGAQMVLIYLIKGRGCHGITPIEALEIAQMIIRTHKNGIQFIEHFCRFHIEQLESNPAYRERFAPYESLIRLAFEPVEEQPSAFRPPVSALQRRFSCNVSAITDEPFQNTGFHLLAKEPARFAEFQTALEASTDFDKPNLLGLTPLHTAVVYGNKEAVKALLENGANINAADIRGFTAMHLAAYYRDHAMMELLLKYHPDLNLKNHFGDTPLLIFCGNYPDRRADSVVSIGKSSYNPRRGEDTATITMLIDAGASYEVADRFGNNIMHHVVTNGNPTFVQFLVDFFTKNERLDIVWSKNNRGLFPVDESLRKNLYHDLGEVFDKSPILEFQEKFERETHGALSFGNLLAQANLSERLRELSKAHRERVAKGEVNTPSPLVVAESTHRKWTPLHCAAAQGHTKVIAVYTDEGASLELRDSFDNTPGHIACLNSQTAFMIALEAAGANLCLTNRDGRTPMHLAAAKGDVKALEHLAKKPARLRAVDGNRHLPIHLASRYGKLLAVKKLLEMDPDTVNATDDDMNTPLHHACDAGHLSVVEHLVASGANPEARNSSGEAPLLIASIRGKGDVVRFLVSNAGVKIHTLDLDRESALHKAALGKFREVVQILLERDQQFNGTTTRLVDLQDMSGDSPLHELGKGNGANIAKIEDTASILTGLIQSRANLRLRNLAGETFLLTAAAHGNLQLFSVCATLRKSRILKLQPCLREVDNNGNGYLHLAAGSGNQYLVQYLIDEELKVNARNSNCETPLFCAIQRGHYHVANLLTTNEADPNLKDGNGRTLIHVILDKPSLDEKDLEYLTSLNEWNPELRFEADKTTRTPIHIIAQRGLQKAFTVLFCEPRLSRELADRHFLREYKPEGETTGKTPTDLAEEYGHAEMAANLRKYLLTKPKSLI